MRVLHVDSATRWRGGQNQVFLTATGMSKRGHQVAVACQAGGALERRCRAAGLVVRPIRFGGDLSPRAVLGLTRVFAETRPQVAQLHDPHAAAAGLLASRLAGSARVVLTRRVDFPLRSALSRLKYRAGARVIAVSRAIADILAESGVVGQRVRLVYEGVEDRPAQPGGEQALQQLGIPPDAPVVGNVAALTDHKDHATLLEAAARVARERPDVRFVVAGEGELRANLEAQARRLNLGERLIFAGFRTDLDRLLPAFAVFCLSSHREGLGTSRRDAMCFSKPVVATTAGGIPEAVEDGVTGRLVPARDPAALAAALVAVLRDPARAKALGQAGRRRFEERFTSERMTDATLSVLEELLA
jgi:glycosyltransferase involved in cell wall biosynthesis